MTRRERKAAYKAQMEREREEWLAQQREAAKAYKALCSRKMVAELRLLKHGCLGFPPNLFGMTMQDYVEAAEKAADQMDARG